MHLRILSITFAALVLAGLSPRRSTAQPTDALARLAFLAGCWELRTPTRVTHEQWMAPLGGMMLGMSRTTTGGTAREWEALHIAVRNGTVTYAAQPGGRPPTFFAATELTDSSVVFANPAHDFPQRIRYHRRGADSLVARIEGDQGGRTRGIDFPMQQVECGELPGANREGQSPRGD